MILNIFFAAIAAIGVFYCVTNFGIGAVFPILAGVVLGLTSYLAGFEQGYGHAVADVVKALARGEEE